MNLKKLILPLLGAALILLGSVIAWRTQTAGGISVHDIRFAGSNRALMSALLYVPPSATARKPAPGILAVHGYMNSRESQDGFAIEFARRGYVVLALDQTGHGFSSPPAFANGFGGPDGLGYLRSLPFVDKSNIGLEGHSMGGWTVLAAAFPDGYKAIVLEGSSTGRPFAAEGTARFPRNLALVFSRYDEFSNTMWDVERGSDVVTSPKLMTLFGTQQPVEIGRLYGDLDAGTARVLYAPAITHAQDHFSTEAIGDSLAWFAQTLEGGVPRSVNDQIWYWKEIGTLAALVGFVVLLIGAFDLLLAAPLLNALAGEPSIARERRDWRWSLALALTIAVPALTYLPVAVTAEQFAPASPLLPQAYTNQIMAWALVNAIIVVVLSFILETKDKHPPPRIGLSVLIALAALAISCGALALGDALFKIDFRFWIFALKPLSIERLAPFLIYAMPLTVYFLLALRALHKTLSVKGESAFSAYLTSIAALAAGFALFHAVQYGTLFVTGTLFTPNQGLLVIIGLQFIPLMTIVALVSTFAYRRTGSYLPGALVCALFVTCYVVAGQALQAKPFV